MNRNTLNKIDKAVFILLIVLAALAILVAMITGPFGYDDVSVGASACACIIAAALLWYTIRTLRPTDRR